MQRQPPAQQWRRAPLLTYEKSWTLQGQKTLVRETQAENHISTKLLVKHAGFLMRLRITNKLY